MDGSTVLFAWNLISTITTGIGVNELHRQLLGTIQRSSLETATLQRELHTSLHEAVDALINSLTQENHPYFQRISNINLRKNEHKRVRSLFDAIKSAFPKTGSILEPVDLLFDNQLTQVGSEKLFSMLGVAEVAEALPEILRNLFVANLSLATLAHFRRRLAMNPGLFNLLQMDLTIAGFQQLRQEINMLATFLSRYSSKEDLESGKLWWQDTSTEFVGRMKEELSFSSFNTETTQQIIRNSDLSVHHMALKLEEIQKNIQLSLEELERLFAAKDISGSTSGIKTVGLRPRLSVGFLNRNREVKTIQELVYSGNNIPIIAILGRAGIGKTALVSHILDQILDRSDVEHNPMNETIHAIICLSSQRSNMTLYDLYTYVCDVVPLETRVRIQNFWHSHEATVDQRVMYLFSSISSQSYVIIMDNFEDSLSSDGTPRDSGLSSFLSLCLSSVHRLKIIITSREPVSFSSGKILVKEVKVENGLGIGDAKQFLLRLDVDGVAQLRDLADNYLTEIASKTYGIPRALEYVFSTLSDGFFSPKQLLDNLNLWHEEVMDSLQAENFRRLGDIVARRVLEVIATVGKPALGQLVQYVLKDEYPALDADSTLRRLAKRAFLSYDPVSRKYSLHPLDQDFLYRSLSPRSKAELHERLANLFERIRPPSENWKSMSDVESILLEFDHRVKSHDYIRAATIVNLIDMDYLSLWGFSDVVLDMRSKLEGNLEGVAKAINLCAIGYAHRRLCNYSVSMQYSKEALALFEQMGMKLEKERCLSDLGHSSFKLGNTEHAFTYYESALVLARSEQDPAAEGRALGNLGHASNKLGKHEEAVEYLMDALEIARKIGDKVGEGKRLDGLGLTFRNLGMYDESKQYFMQALQLRVITNDKRGECITQNNLSLLQRSMGHYDEAERSAYAALTIARNVQDHRSEGIALSNIASILVKKGKLIEAVDVYNSSLIIARKIGDKHGEGIKLNNLGALFMRLSRYTEALDCFRSALEIAQEVGNERMIASRIKNVRLAEFSITK